MGTPCEGKVEEVEMFDGQIKIPICEQHLEEHRDIMILHKHKYDIEEILQESAEYRRQEVLVLKLSGLDDDDDDVSI
jgi:hypothetical protein